MNQTKIKPEQPELLAAIKNSIGDARQVITELAAVFTERIQPLRMEESESVFNDLTQNINDLQGLLEFLYELRRGMHYFEDFGLPEDPISSGNEGLNLFKEMLESMESRDWIMLADLIEYELSPLLIREEEWLGRLDERLEGTGLEKI
jgi:hypothetical protein